MKYKFLGNTDLNVSRLCLGTMTMGWTSTKQDSFALMDYAIENGINFFDTADIYSFWAAGNEGGVAESWLGEWMKSRRSRHKVTIATKVRGRMWDGPDGEGLSRAHLIQAVEGSLRRLQVDTIDLYQSHWPDEETPIEETLQAYSDLISEGKVRYIGTSNYTPTQLENALNVSAAHNWPRYESLQPHYNLVHRQEFEAELMALSERENLGVIPYSPLAQGFLTGKYKRGGEAPADSRGRGNDRMRPYMNEKGYKILESLTEISRNHHASCAQVALAWILANPAVTSAIVGANTVAQLVDTIAAADLVLSAEEKARLDNLPSPT